MERQRTFIIFTAAFLVLALAAGALIYLNKFLKPEKEIIKEGAVKREFTQEEKEEILKKLSESASVTGPQLLEKEKEKTLKNLSAPAAKKNGAAETEKPGLSEE